MTTVPNTSCSLPLPSHVVPRGSRCCQIATFKSSLPVRGVCSGLASWSLDFKFLIKNWGYPSSEVIRGFVCVKCRQAIVPGTGGDPHEPLLLLEPPQCPWALRMTQRLSHISQGGTGAFSRVCSSSGKGLSQG